MQFQLVLVLQSSSGFHPSLYNWTRKVSRISILIKSICKRITIPSKNRIAVHQHEFAKRNVKILAHSVDQLKSHVDWVNDIKSYCLDIPGEFPYPIIADPNRDLAVKFGMLDEQQVNDPDAATTVRALFIISPDHRVRLTMHYPASCGRSVDEILRCIDSLQLTDRLKIVATPANCKFIISRINFILSHPVLVWAIER